MKKEHIRLIALDMDGTLLRSDKTVAPDTLSAIEEAVRLGIPVAYCTGRAVAELAPYKDILSQMRYGVCLCGSQIYDFHERRSIYKRPINNGFIRKLISISEKYDAAVQLLTEDRSIMRSDKIDRLADYNLAVYQSMFRRIATAADDLGEAVRQYGTILKSNVHFHTPEARQQAYEELRSLPLSFVFSEISTLELMADGVSKATGIAMLARCLNIPMSDVMGIGDGNNDRQMLMDVGTSVAMGNSSDALKSVSDSVTEDNDHDGVGLAIRRHLHIS